MASPTQRKSSTSNTGRARSDEGKLGKDETDRGRGTTTANQKSGSRSKAPTPAARKAGQGDSR